MALTVDKNRCPQNHKCPMLRVCPVDAITQDGYGLPRIDPENVSNAVNALGIVLWAQ